MTSEQALALLTSLPPLATGRVWDTRGPYEPFPERSPACAPCPGSQTPPEPCSPQDGPQQSCQVASVAQATAKLAGGISSTASRRARGLSPPNPTQQLRGGTAWGPGLQKGPPGNPLKPSQGRERDVGTRLRGSAATGMNLKHTVHGLHGPQPPPTVMAEAKRWPLEGRRAIAGLL